MRARVCTLGATAERARRGPGRMWARGRGRASGAPDCRVAVGCAFACSRRQRGRPMSRHRVEGRLVLIVGLLLSGLVALAALGPGNVSPGGERALPAAGMVVGGLCLAWEESAGSGTAGPERPRPLPSSARPLAVPTVQAAAPAPRAPCTRPRWPGSAGRRWRPAPPRLARAGRAAGTARRRGRPAPGGQPGTPTAPAAAPACCAASWPPCPRRRAPGRAPSGAGSTGRPVAHLALAQPAQAASRDVVSAGLAHGAARLSGMRGARGASAPSPRVRLLCPGAASATAATPAGSAPVRPAARRPPRRQLGTRRAAGAHPRPPKEWGKGTADVAPGVCGCSRSGATGCGGADTRQPRSRTPKFSTPVLNTSSTRPPHRWGGAGDTPPALRTC